MNPPKYKAPRLYIWAPNQDRGFIFWGGLSAQVLPLGRGQIQIQKPSNPPSPMHFFLPFFIYKKRPEINRMKQMFLLK